MWLTHKGARADAAARPEPRALAVATSVIAESPRRGTRVRSARLEPDDDFALRWQDAPSEPIAAGASFSERFGFDRSDASSQVLLSFDDRFGGPGLGSDSTVRSAAAESRTTSPRIATAGAPRAAAREVVARAVPKPRPKARFQLASASETSLSLGYATDSGTSAGVTGSPKGLAPKDSDPLAEMDTSHTAIYDITSHTVYLPNGRRLEAHSGLGGHMDDPRSVSKKKVGVTPPNVYDLRMRESLFHGVRAIRLIPNDDSKMYGRDGILAHSYMLGPNGQSNGCVSFSDYSAFLAAYERGEVTRLVVVEHLADAPSPTTAADWFANKLKDVFQRS